MLRLGMLCPPAIGHLNPMCALAHELKRRGCAVVFFCLPDAAAMLDSAGMEYVVYGETEFPAGSVKTQLTQLGQLTGLKALRFTVVTVRTAMQSAFRHLPACVKQEGLDALVVDQISSSGATVADYCGLPFVTVCNALPTNQEDGVPPFFTAWRQREGSLARLRNKLGNALFERVLLRPTFNATQTQRRAWNLPPHTVWEDGQSKLATICQLPAEFDFRRTKLPDNFHYVGPLQNPSRAESLAAMCPPFPFDKLNGKPLIYASLGTLQNKIWDVFQRIAAACDGLEAQLVISLGDPGAAPPRALPATPVVVSFVPQQKIIDRAALVITHAGMNTTLGALSSGVPLIAIPITNEQPGIATRMVHTGAGEMLPVSRLTATRLRRLITRVLGTETYRTHALRMREAIRRAGGVARAADITLQAISTGNPVLRNAGPPEVRSAV